MLGDKLSGRRNAVTCNVDGPKPAKQRASASASLSPLENARMIQTYGIEACQNSDSLHASQVRTAKYVSPRLGIIGHSTGKGYISQETSFFPPK
jgi:hypothetical protein